MLIVCGMEVEGSLWSKVKSYGSIFSFFFHSWGPLPDEMRALLFGKTKKSQGSNKSTWCFITQMALAISWSSPSHPQACCTDDNSKGAPITQPPNLSLSSHVFLKFKAATKAHYLSSQKFKAKKGQKRLPLIRLRESAPHILQHFYLSKVCTVHFSSSSLVHTGHSKGRSVPESSCEIVRPAKIGNITPGMSPAPQCCCTNVTSSTMQWCTNALQCTSNNVTGTTMQ